MSSIISLLYGDLMATTEREKIQENIQKWLVEEGYTVKLIDDPKTYYTIITQHPTGITLIVAQEIGKRDRITIFAKIDFPEEIVKKLRELPDEELQSLLWDIRFSLTYLLGYN